MSVLLFDIRVFVVSISPGRYKNAYLWRRKFMPTPRIFPRLRLVMVHSFSCRLIFALLDPMKCLDSYQQILILCYVQLCNLKTSSLIFINLILSLFSAIIRSFHIHDFRYFVRNTNLQFFTWK